MFIKDLRQLMRDLDGCINYSGKTSIKAQKFLHKEANTHNLEELKKFLKEINEY